MNNCPLRQSRQPSTRWLLGAARVLRTQPRTSARKYALRRLCTKLQKYRGCGENWPNGEGRGQTGCFGGPEVAGKPCRDRPKRASRANGEQCSRKRWRREWEDRKSVV